MDDSQSKPSLLDPLREQSDAVRDARTRPTRTPAEELRSRRSTAAVAAFRWLDEASGTSR